ncbi:hypothetical protein BKA70DRAFT_1575486 [Coprinopsis sp. MPI-PUGE-AT-0042]|nr:hypothetical protein BKA70DRAFT_1575486 [Coprinopsis sp. MPI-PUGE-AT-0042]
MGQETSSPVPQDASGDGELYLTDIILKRTDTANDDRTPLSLTELWVFGIPGSEEGNCYTLTNVTSGQWHLIDFIWLPSGVAGIDCVARSKEGEDVAFAHLDPTDSGMRSAHMHSEHGSSQSMEMYGEGICLIVLWKTVEIPLDTILPNEDIGALNNIGVDMMREFERTGDLVTVNEAMEVLDRAVKLTPKGHADLPACLNNLGTSFQRRFEHTGDLSDIAEAISAQRRAMQLTPEGHADLPACLNNLGNSFQRRFEHTGDLSDIAEAISAQRRAVQLTPKGHADLPAHLNNLGSSFQRRFEHTGDLSDIAEAISAQQRAVQLTPKGHADLAGRLNNLGNSFQCRFEHTGEEHYCD